MKIKKIKKKKHTYSPSSIHMRQKSHRVFYNKNWTLVNRGAKYQEINGIQT